MIKKNYYRFTCGFTLLALGLYVFDTVRNPRVQKGYT